jgi:hypothetical protein
MIKEIINLLQSSNWYKTGFDVIEQAKGSQELVTSIKIAKRKIKRKWQLSKK